MRFFRFCLLTALLGGLAAAHPAQAQNQVANYGCGKPGTAAYEHFSFWIDNYQRTDIQYAYGKNRTDFRPRYAGPIRLHGRPGFKIQFANRRTLYLLPSGTTLRVTTSTTATPKTFVWEYEGPVNGVGMVCSVCAPDAAAAMHLLRQYYLKY